MLLSLRLLRFLPRAASMRMVLMQRCLDQTESRTRRSPGPLLLLPKFQNQVHVLEHSLQQQLWALAVKFCTLVARSVGRIRKDALVAAENSPPKGRMIMAMMSMAM